MSGFLIAVYRRFPQAILLNIPVILVMTLLFAYYLLTSGMELFAAELNVIVLIITAAASIAMILLGAFRKLRITDLLLWAAGLGAIVAITLILASFEPPLWSRHNLVVSLIGCLVAAIVSSLLYVATRQVLRFFKRYV
jgi:hypothetical protein